MKRGQFKQKTLAEVKGKQALKLARMKAKPRKATKPKKQPKRTATAKKTGKKRKVKSNSQKLRAQCDALLTPIIKKMYPYCLLSGEPTEVAHHHVKKSESNALRYYIPNLIPLTHKQHSALHSHETLYSSRIVAIKGIDWWEDIERKKREFTKTDVQFYRDNLERLQGILDSL